MPDAPAHTDLAPERARQELEGVDRVNMLSEAEFVCVMSASGPEEPVVVIIGWRRDVVERPYAGTAIWRAALQRFAHAARDGTPTDGPLIDAAMRSLDRFPTLDRWLAWHDHERRPPSKTTPQPAVRSWIGR